MKTLNKHFFFKTKKIIKYIYTRTYIHILAEGAVSSVVTEHYQQPQQNLSGPIGIVNTQTNQTFGGIQTTGSFHSVSSADSSAEMAKYFPDAQTPNLSPYR